MGLSLDSRALVHGACQVQRSVARVVFHENCLCALFVVGQRLYWQSKKLVSLSKKFMLKNAIARIKKDYEESYLPQRGQDRRSVRRPCAARYRRICPPLSSGPRRSPTAVLSWPKPCGTRAFPPLRAGLSYL